MTRVVRAGFVTRPRGLSGEVEVRLFLAGRAVGLPQGFEAEVGGRALGVLRSSVRSVDTISVLFEGIDTVEAAEELRGADFCAGRDSFLAVPGLRPMGLFLGMRMEWQDGGGIVEGFDAFSANPLLEISWSGGGFEVPLLLVTETGTIDWDGGCMRLRLPAGLAAGAD